MSRISTHVLDTAKGCPAANLEVTLECEKAPGAWEILAHASTNLDGRVGDLMNGHQLRAGTYRLSFATADYHEGEGFFPSVTVVFTIKDPTRPYHVPLLLSPYGFSTYRGS